MVKLRWDTIQANAEMMKDRTALLFVTNDHGRHLDGHKDGFVGTALKLPRFVAKSELLAIGLTSVVERR
jgi:hypothetical protein